MGIAIALMIVWEVRMLIIVVVMKEATAAPGRQQQLNHNKTISLFHRSKQDSSRSTRREEKKYRLNENFVFDLVTSTHRTINELHWMMTNSVVRSSECAVGKLLGTKAGNFLSSANHKISIMVE